MLKIKTFAVSKETISLSQSTAYFAQTRSGKNRCYNVRKLNMSVTLSLYTLNFDVMKICPQNESLSVRQITYHV